MIHLLIVDDDRTFLDAAVEFLTREGFEAVGTDGFGRAVKLLERTSPDVLITDIRLGEYNGLYLLLRFRASHPRMITLVMSGFPDEAIAREARQYGARDYFTKPVSLALLCDRIRAYVGERTPRRWPRKQLNQALPANVDGSEAWITNVSYGGLLLDLEREMSVGAPVNVVVPTWGLTFQAKPVWIRPSPARRHLCGAELEELPSDSRTVWQGFVDMAPVS
jgi:DNA-binding response OmpR family regulator